MKVRNTFIIFIVSGFWHGANWTFIVWGGLNAIYFLPLLLTKRNRKYLDNVAEGKYLPNLKEMFAMLTTFGLTLFAWIFFRAESIPHAITYISGIFSSSLFGKPTVFPVDLIILILTFLVIEWLGRDGQFALDKFGRMLNPVFRFAVYYLIIIAIFWFGGQEQEFIYFQF